MCKDDLFACTTKHDLLVYKKKQTCSFNRAKKLDWIPLRCRPYSPFVMSCLSEAALLA